MGCGYAEANIFSSVMNMPPPPLPPNPNAFHNHAMVLCRVVSELGEEIMKKAADE